jgi:outer membrane lipoprotein-sorting protein
MAELHEQEAEFSQLLEGLPVDDAPRPEQAERVRRLVLARFDQGTEAAPTSPWWKRALNEGRDIMRRPVPRLIAGAAACLAVLTWLLLPGGPSTARAFSRFAEVLVNAKTARFDMEVTVQGQPKQKFKAFYLAPGRFRQEVGSMINVSDLAAGKTVMLMPSQKRALEMNLKGAPKEKLAYNYFERVRELLSGNRDSKDSKFERVGEKEIEGKRAVGFRYDSSVATIMLWGDPGTGLPLRIENVLSGIPRTEVVMSNFEINVELAKSLFDVTPPADYKVQSFDVDASESREQDVVDAFKACGEIGAGDFPDALDTAGVNKLIIKYAMSQGKNISEEKIQQLMKESIKIGRGFQFVLELPEAAEAHYAGKGVKRDAKDRPIFWYKPAGANRYRVLYADLTFRDADTAPQVVGAVRIEKASQGSKAGKE